MMLTPKSPGFTKFQGATFVVVQSIDTLADQLLFCTQDAFTGQLDLKIEDTQISPVSLYFQKGDLIWISGGTHPTRRWYRQLFQVLPASAIGSITKKENQDQQWVHHFLTTLLVQKKINQKDIEFILKGAIVEIFFDLHQQWFKHQGFNLRMKFNYAHLDSIKTPYFGISLNETWLKALEIWKAWQKAGLENYSPNQAPMIRNAKELQQQVLPVTYQNLISMMDGRQTLRDITLKANKPLLTVTKSFIPYVDQGLIELIEIEDWQSLIEPRLLSISSSLSILSSSNPVLFQSQAPLIAHVDDHHEDGQTMSKILTQLGYRSIHIRDSIQALPIMLDHEPDLIFLDLVMPIINGYEACTQIRRISRFKDTPIIILTSSDGILDRVRAKFVGSTDFLAKPIQPQKVQAVLQKFLVPLKTAE